MSRLVNGLKLRETQPYHSSIYVFWPRMCVLIQPSNFPITNLYSVKGRFSDLRHKIFNIKLEFALLRTTNCNVNKILAKVTRYHLF